MNTNTHTLVSSGSLESLKKMVEKLDADNKMLIEVVKTFRQRFHTSRFEKMGVQMTDIELFNYAKEAIAKATE